MFRYDYIFLTVAAVVLFILLILFYYKKAWANRVKNKLVDQHLFFKILPTFSSSKLKWKNVLLTMGLLITILALGRPRWGTKEEEVKREGIDLMIALDVSNSMLAQDLSPNRLGRSKLALLQLVNKLKNDRIGIIVFGGQAYVQLPITSDYSAAKLFINTINTQLIPTQGTAIGSAIDLSIKSFNPESPTQKAIIVITDGENHEDDAIEAAQRAKSKGIFVHTIGMGSEQGAPIPTSANGNYKKDKEGNTVITRLNEEMLKDIADAGNGIFVRASNANSGLNTVLNELSKLEKTEYGSVVFTDFEDYYQSFLIVAIFILLFELLLDNKASSLARKINLFEKNKK